MALWDNPYAPAPRRRGPIGDPSATALFAGEKSQTADHAALATARQMEGTGADRREIWDKTGWWNDGGAWSYEASPDKPPTYNPPNWTKKQRSFPLGFVHSDPTLRKAYPQMGLMPVKELHSEEEHQGLFMGKDEQYPLGYIAMPRTPGKIDPSMVMQHEKQHAVDDIENAYSHWGDESHLPWEFQRQERRAQNSSHRDYHMTPEQRKKIAPWESEGQVMQYWYGKDNPGVDLTQPHPPTGRVQK